MGFRISICNSRYMTTHKNQYFQILVTMGYTQFSIAFLQSQKSFFVFKLKKFLNIFTKTQKKNIDQNKNQISCSSPNPTLHTRRCQIRVEFVDHLMKKIPAATWHWITHIFCCPKIVLYNMVTPTCKTWMQLL